MEELLEQIERMISRGLRPLQSRLMSMVSRAVVRTVTDSFKMQTVQVSTDVGNVNNDRERYQNYGNTSVPLPPDADGKGAEAIIVSNNGNPDDGIVIVVDDRRYRLTGLTAGEVAMYDDLGQFVKLGRSTLEVSTLATGNDIEVDPGAGQVLLAGGGNAVGRVGDACQLGTCTLGGVHAAGPPWGGAAVGGAEISAGSAKVESG